MMPDQDGNGKVAEPVAPGCDLTEAEKNALRVFSEYLDTSGRQAGERAFWCAKGRGVSQADMQHVMSNAIRNWRDEVALYAVTNDLAYPGCVEVMQEVSVRALSERFTELLMSLPREEMPQ